MTEHRYSHVARFVQERCWAILPSTFDVMQEVLSLRLEGVVFSDEEIQARVAAVDRGPRAGASRSQAVAVIPVYGVLSQRGGMMAKSSGGTSVEGLRAQLNEALADRDVSAIVLDIDSPGGSVDGIPELAAEIRAARASKPVYAIANAMAASAAVWIGAQAERFYATTSGQVGSIGVIAQHEDDSVAREGLGVKRTIIAEPPGKADGWGGDPISEEGLGDMRGKVQAYYQMFVGDLAKGRAVPVDTVREKWGKGAMLLARDAAEVGLVDGVETLDSVVRLAARAARQRETSAAALRPAASLDRGTLAALLAIPPDQLAKTRPEAMVFLQAMLGDATHVGIDAGEDDPDDEGAIELPGLDLDEDAGEPEDGDARTAGLGSGLPFGDHLSRVSAEVEGLAERARDRARVRAQAGRGLGTVTREELRKIAALRPVLDEIGAMAADDEPPAPVKPAGLTPRSMAAAALAAQARIRMSALEAPATPE